MAFFAGNYALKALGFFMRVCIIKSAEFIGWKRSGSKVKKMIYGSIEYVLKLSPFIWDFLQVISDRDDVACRCAPPLPFVTARAPNQCWCYTSQASFDSRWHANANRPKSASSQENSRGKPALPIDRYNKNETFTSETRAFHPITHLKHK